jgi:hypothetical protein
MRCVVSLVIYSLLVAASTVFRVLYKCMTNEIIKMVFPKVFFLARIGMRKGLCKQADGQWSKAEGLRSRHILRSYIFYIS